jgi:hypothetical protein
MPSSDIPRNAYTNAPEQHPNLILGSLQLLFWLVFRPTAWCNHLNRIDPALDRDYDIKSPLRWRNPALWRLLIQGYIVLPLLINLTGGLFLWLQGKSLEKIVLIVTSGIGISIGLSLGLSVKWSARSNLLLSMGLSLMLYIASNLLSVLPPGVLYEAVLGMVFGVVLFFYSRLVLPIGSGVGLSVILGVVFSDVDVRLVFSVPVITSALLYPCNILLYYLDKLRLGTKPSLLRFHSAFWYEWQSFPLLNMLDKHLLLVIKRNPAEGKAAIDYLRSTNHFWAIQAVQIELDIRSLERCKDVKAIRQVHRQLEIGEIETPISPELGFTNRISEDVDAALNQKGAYNQRLVLRDVADRINLHLQGLNRSSDKYASRFYPIAKSWHQIITKYIEELAKETELRQEIDSPYIIGVPLTQQQEIFTGRNDIGTRIEQLLLDRRRPPLLLYGQRRMGKTSLLNNLGKLLPIALSPCL